jgi:AcrR family transcriptional regulator
MGTKERREHKKARLREGILNAARELFVQDGYHGVSMRRVAEKIEYSPTAIYSREHGFSRSTVVFPIAIPRDSDEPFTF